jgi:hypothetical protein
MHVYILRVRARLGRRPLGRSHGFYSRRAEAQRALVVSRAPLLGRPLPHLQAVGRRPRLRPAALLRGRVERRRVCATYVLLSTIRLRLSMQLPIHQPRTR